MDLNAPTSPDVRLPAATLGQRRFSEFTSRLRLLPHTGEVWVPLCRSSVVAAGQLHKEQLLGRPIVLFRDRRGLIRAIEDRCPHRGVALSLGRCLGDGVQCPYHGLVVDGEGRCGSEAVDFYAVQEHLGLIWVFVGAPFRASEVELPDFSPFGDPRRLDTILSMDADTHWSFVLDNGMDLTHDHLHRDITFFFKTLAIADMWAHDDRIHVSYDAEIRDEFNRRKRARVHLDIERNVFRLDFAGQPIIYSVLTPRSRNGRRVTQWWFVSYHCPRWMKPFYAIALPLVRRVMMSAFRQDRLMLEAECAAVFEHRHGQSEVNPVLGAIHAHLTRQVTRRVRDGMMMVPTEDMARDKLLEEVGRGELAVMKVSGGSDGPLTADELRRCLGDEERVTVRKYWQMALIE